MKIEIEKPVIPRFVAEWLESLYHEGGSEYDALGIMFEYISKHDKTVHDWYVDNKDTFITAVMYGYEVEEEPFYYARVKGWENKYLNGPFYWNHITFAGGENKISIADYAHEGSDIYAKTKEDWNKVGINDTNADFEEVE